MCTVPCTLLPTCACMYTRMCVCRCLCVHVGFCISVHMCFVSEHSILQSHGQLFVCFSHAVASLARLLQDTFSLCSTFISSCFYFPSVCTLTKHTALNWPLARLELVLLRAIDRQIWLVWFALAAMLGCTGQVATRCQKCMAKRVKAAVNCSTSRRFHTIVFKDCDLQGFRLNHSHT